MSEFQLRFSWDEKKIYEIFKTGDISKSFNESFGRNEKLLRKRISEFKEYLFSLCKKEDDISDEDEELFPSLKRPTRDQIEVCIPDRKIILQFKKDVQRRLLWLAINDIFDTKVLNIRQNILALLNSDIIRRFIQGKILVYTFGSLLHKIDKYDYLEGELIHHFFSEDINS